MKRSFVKGAIVCCLITAVVGVSVVFHSVSDGGPEAQAPGLLAPANEPNQSSQMETLVLEIPVNYATVDYTSSMTIISSADAKYPQAVAERPADCFLNTYGGEPFNPSVIMTSAVPFKGVINSSIGVGLESELRFSGIYQFQGTSITSLGETPRRFCWRKAPNGWVYVSGTGVVERAKDGKKRSDILGGARTVGSCLALLNAKDPILREGASRDLGWLATTEDLQLIVSSLTPLLKDPSLYVRRGAAEGLGLLGTGEAFAVLDAAIKTENDEVTVKYFKEALALSVGDMFVNPSPLLSIHVETAAATYAGGRSAWTDEVLGWRALQRGNKAVELLAGYSASSDDTVKELATRIKDTYEELIRK